MPEPLHTVNYAGPTSERPLLIVHGLFGSARNWNGLAKRFALKRPVTCVDLRNHGQSPWAATQSYEDMADDLAGVVETIGGPVNLLGHSMGGKAAMMLALDCPDLVARLVVADIAPVAYTHSHAPFIGAMRGLDISSVTRRSEADALLVPVVEDAPTRAFLLSSLDLSSEPPRWMLNLEVLEREIPRILSFPVQDGQYQGPALFLSGGASHYVRPEHHGLIEALFPAAHFDILEDAGHWLHAEKTREFIASVEAFLS